MKNYQRTVHINAEPQKVYEAITEQKGLEGWWTADCTVKPQEGSRNTFRFGETYTVMEVENLIPSQKVQWKCVDHNHIDDTLTKPDEWVNTRITFDLQDGKNGGTDLSFTHEGLNESLQCYDICHERWGHFLKISLKGYVETGQGDPFGVLKTPG
jgi:uncharacterized protein YndB with AHSA1/START domain